jgi:hypothetical protein
VTNGTAAGTSELQVSWASAGELFTHVFRPEFTVVGGRALFAGEDANGNINLWITDGTSAGSQRHSSSIPIRQGNQNALLNHTAKIQFGPSPCLALMPRRAHRVRRQQECHLYFARRESSLSCADSNPESFAANPRAAEAAGNMLSISQAMAERCSRRSPSLRD